MNAKSGTFRLQSSFELLITLSFGLAILLPIVVFAFIQVANANAALSSFAAQQVAEKIAAAATLVGQQGPPAKQAVLVSMPPGVQYIYLGTTSGTIGHEIVLVLRSPAGLSYVTAYSPVNVSGSLLPIVSAGTYIVNVSATSTCPTNSAFPCVYITPAS